MAKPIRDRSAWDLRAKPPVLQWPRYLVHLRHVAASAPYPAPGCEPAWVTAPGPEVVRPSDEDLFEALYALVGAIGLVEDEAPRPLQDVCLPDDIARYLWLLLYAAPTGGGPEGHRYMRLAPAGQAWWERAGCVSWRRSGDFRTFWLKSCVTEADAWWIIEELDPCGRNSVSMAYADPP